MKSQKNLIIYTLNFHILTLTLFLKTLPHPFLPTHLSSIVNDCFSFPLVYGLQILLTTIFFFNRPRDFYNVSSLLCNFAILLLDMLSRHTSAQMLLLLMIFISLTSSNHLMDAPVEILSVKLALLVFNKVLKLPLL